MDLRQFELVVAGIECVIIVTKGGVAAMTAYRLGGHDLVGVVTERASATFAPDAALAGAFWLGLVGTVRFLAFRRRQAGIVRRLRRRQQIVQPLLKFGDARESLAQLRRLRQNEGILLGGRELGGVGCRRAHTAFRIESPVTESTGFSPAVGLPAMGGLSSYHIRAVWYYRA